MTGPDREDEGDPATGEDGIVRAEFDWSSRSPSRAVVEVVAIAANAEPTTLGPLYDSVDPDALDALVRPGGSGSEGGAVTVEFELAGRDVRVHSAGVVVVFPAT